MSAALDQLREAARTLVAHYDSVAGHPRDMDVGVLEWCMAALRTALDAPQGGSCPSGYTPVEAYAGKGEVVVCGTPESDDADHNCDALGCSSVSHVIHRTRLKPAHAPQAESGAAPSLPQATAYEQGLFDASQRNPALYVGAVRALWNLARGNLSALGAVNEDYQGAVDAIVVKMQAEAAPKAGAGEAYVAWRIADRNGRTWKASHERTLLDRECDSLNGEKGRAHYLACGPYYVAPLYAHHAPASPAMAVVEAVAERIDAAIAGLGGAGPEVRT